MTELRDTISLMESPDYRDQLLAEYYQLCIRISALKLQIDRYYAREAGLADKLGDFDYPVQVKVETLVLQLSCMRAYKYSLEKRAKEVGIVF